MSLIEGSGLQRKETLRHKTSLSPVLDTIVVSLGRASDYRIRSPFEAAIEKGSITKDDLRRWGSLPIELLGAHNPDGTFIVSTGSPARTNYDWPDNLSLRERLRVWRTTIIKSWLRLQNSQPFIIHNHPHDHIPSPTDVGSSRVPEILLTRRGIIVYKRRFDLTRKTWLTEEEYEEMGEQKALDFLKKSGTIMADIAFDDPRDTLRMEAIVAFINSTTSWKDTEKVLRASVHS